MDRRATRVPDRPARHRHARPVQDELACHFAIPADHRELWGAFRRAIAFQTGPYRLHLKGWADFERRMPRYARRLRRFIEDYQTVHGEERLAADYA